MNLKKGITEGSQFGGPSIPDKGVVVASVAGGVPGADISAVAEILRAEGRRVSNTKVNDEALAASGKGVKQVKPGGIDLATVDPALLEGKADFSPKGYHVNNEDVPQNANRLVKTL